MERHILKPDHIIDFQNYQTLAINNNTSIAEAAAGQKLDPNLDSFARKIDRLDHNGWKRAELSYIQGTLNGSIKVLDNPLTIISQDDKNNTPQKRAIEKGFNAAGQISYIRNYWGVDFDEKNVDLLESPRLANAVSNAALELYFRVPLADQNYKFPNLKSLIWYNEMLDLVSDTSYLQREQERIQAEKAKQEMEIVKSQKSFKLKASHHSG